MKKLIFAGFALSLFAVACKKDDNNGGNNTPVKTRKDTVTSGKWRFTSVTGTANFFGQDTTVDIYANFMDACTRDNYVIFRLDSTVTNDEGPTKCDATSPQQSPGGNWYFTPANDSLILTNGTLPGRFQLATFSNISMRLKGQTTYSGIPVKLDAILNHE